VGVIGPIGSGLPQLGLPRRFAMKDTLLLNDDRSCLYSLQTLIQKNALEILHDSEKM
jgi:hypothetical protein